MTQDKVVESTHDIPSTLPTIEERFKNSDGTFNQLAAQQYLINLQAKGEAVPLAEMQEAIAIIRLLRRTNTGPATKRPGKKTAKRDLPLDELLPD